MKSPKVKGIGEVATEYGAKVMKVIKKGLLGRSLFDFYGDVKTNALRIKESSTVPLTPNDKDGVVLYVKNSDGRLYYKSNEVAEVEVSDKNYIHDQGIAGSTWSINHSLKKFPSVTVVDSAGTVVIGMVDYTDLNNLTITFSSGFSGKAYLN
jgi:hypothetical protein